MIKPSPYVKDPFERELELCSRFWQLLLFEIVIVNEERGVMESMKVVSYLLQS